MITLKEYEIYLKVKEFIEIVDCDENALIPKLPTKYYSLSAAARGCGILKQTIVYAYRNRCTRIARRKGGYKVFRIEWLD